MSAIDDAAYYAELGREAAAKGEEVLFERGRSDSDVLAASEREALRQLIVAVSHLSVAVRELAAAQGAVRE